MKLSSIDPVKCPALYRAVKQMHDRRGDHWGQVVALRTSGQLDAADRLVRKLLGVQGPPMSEEVKQKLREYNEIHKDEIRERRNREREVRARTLALLQTGSKRGKRS